MWLLTERPGCVLEKIFQVGSDGWQGSRSQSLQKGERTAAYTWLQLAPHAMIPRLLGTTTTMRTLQRRESLGRNYLSSNFRIKRVCHTTMPEQPVILNRAANVGGQMHISLMNHIYYASHASPVFQTYAFTCQCQPCRDLAKFAMP